MATITRDDIPEFLRPLVNSDNDLALAQDCAARVQDYFQQTKRTIDVRGALELLSLVPTTDVPTKLADFGFDYNSSGQLRQISNGEKFVYINEALYQGMGDLIVPHIHKIMVTDPQYDMDELPIPVDATTNTPQTKVFATKDAFTNDKLLLLIHGAGAVRAGQWARALCINESLDIGSVLPYIRRAKSEGYAVIVLNPNDNQVPDPTAAQPQQSLSGFAAMKKWLSYKLKELPKSLVKLAPVRVSAQPEEHVLYVWENLVRKAAASRVGIVAHSYGGVSTLNLLCMRSDDVLKRLRAVAFTDAVHRVSSRDPKPVLDFIRNHSINWVSSSEPLDTPAPSSLQPCVSAGHPKHEWTSAACITSVFPFLAKNFQ